MNEIRISGEVQALGFLNLHTLFQQGDGVENHWFRLHLFIVRLISLYSASVFRTVAFALPRESDCIFPRDGLAHHQKALDYDYVLEPKGWEGYLETQSKSFVVSLACNSNKCNPSALSWIRKNILCRQSSVYEWVVFQNLFVVSC